VKSIPTEYNGVLFRSRLEANWAAYLDFIGAQWVYEPEGYELANGVRYLPDFYLPETNSWFECKGPLTSGTQKAALFCRETGQTTVIGFIDGQFLVLGEDNVDLGLVSPLLLASVLMGESAEIREYMGSYSSLALCDESRHRFYRFWNGGAMLDAYCCRSSDSDGGWIGERLDDDDDPYPVRPTYFTGLSTWVNRGFVPSRWQPNAPMVGQRSPMSLR
jgi:hypothetical protein